VPAREVNRLTLGRELVEGSGILQDTRRNEYPLQQIGAKEVIFSPLSEGGFLHYRPRLKMLLADYQLKTDEWGCVSGWEISLEEI